MSTKALVLTPHNRNACHFGTKSIGQGLLDSGTTLKDIPVDLKQHIYYEIVYAKHSAVIRLYPYGRASKMIEMPLAIKKGPAPRVKVVTLPSVAAKTEKITQADWDFWKLGDPISYAPRKAVFSLN